MADAANNLFNPTALANGTSNLIVRADALNQSTDLVQAGVVFNDAVRFSQGLFSLSGSGNQNPFLGSYTTDIHAVQNDIAAMLAAPGDVTVGGQAFALNATDTAVLTNVQSQLGTLLTAAAQTTNAATSDGCGPDDPCRAERDPAGDQQRSAYRGRAQQRSRSWPIRAPTTSRSRTFRQAPMIRQHSLRQRRAPA